MSNVRRFIEVPCQNGDDYAMGDGQVYPPRIEPATHPSDLDQPPPVAMGWCDPFGCDFPAGHEPLWSEFSCPRQLDEREDFSHLDSRSDIAYGARAIGTGLVMLLGMSYLALVRWITGIRRS